MGGLILSGKIEFIFLAGLHEKHAVQIWYPGSMFHCVLLIHLSQKINLKISAQTQPSRFYQNFFIMLPSKHKMQPKCLTSFLFSRLQPSITLSLILFTIQLFTYLHLTFTSISPLHPSDFYIPSSHLYNHLTFTGRTWGHCLGIFRAINFLFQL